ncbi:MAG: hypothetical protein AABX00_06390 [Nanoarchaeota archaeon]
MLINVFGGLKQASPSIGCPKRQDIYIKRHRLLIMDTITLPRSELEQLHREIETLRNSGLYKRLLEFEKNISEGSKFTRKDLGF